MTELVFILDRSGSMSGLESDTIGGFNSMIEKQKKESGEALISTVLFDNESTVIHDRLPLDKVPRMTEKEYYTRGCTALLDAVGGAIHHIRNIHKYARKEDIPSRTLFVITTDGYENASKRYDYTPTYSHFSGTISTSSGYEDRISWIFSWGLRRSNVWASPSKVSRPIALTSSRYSGRIGT